MAPLTLVSSFLKRKKKCTFIKYERFGSLDNSKIIFLLEETLCLEWSTLQSILERSRKPYKELCSSDVTEATWEMPRVTGVWCPVCAGGRWWQRAQRRGKWGELGGLCHPFYIVLNRAENPWLHPITLWLMLTTKYTLFSLLCVYVCTHLCVGIWVYCCECLWRPKDGLECHSSRTVHLVFWDRASHWPGSHWLGRLAGQWAPKDPPASVYLVVDCSCSVPHHTQLSCGLASQILPTSQALYPGRYPKLWDLIFIPQNLL